MFDDEKIEFSYCDDDFTREGKLNFNLLPEYKPKYEKGYLVNKEEVQPYYDAKDKNKLLKKFTKYQLNEDLWENYGRLSPLQQRALTLLVSGHNINQIATECNIERSTIYRWLQLDIFTKTLKLWQQKLLIEADNKIRLLGFKALDELETMLDNCQDEKNKIEILKLIINLVYGTGKK